MTTPDPTTSPVLAALVERARLDAAARTSDAVAEAAVLRLLTEADGSLPLRALISTGAPQDAVARLCEPPADKRARPRARLGMVADEPVVWLTSTGWQATGRSSGREVVPSSDSVRHAQAPAGLARFLDSRRATLAANGVTLRTTYGGAMQRRFSAEASARAWAALRSSSDGEGDLGTLTGGWLPDALVVEGWPSGASGKALYTRAWGTTPRDDDDLAETTVVVEVEDTRKSADPLRSKVSRCDAGIRIGLCRAVIWVVRTNEVARSLTALGIGNPARRGSQLLVPAKLVGLDGEDIDVAGRTWWPMTVPVDG